MTALSRLRQSTLFRWDPACVVGGSLGLISLFMHWCYWPGRPFILGHISEQITILREIWNPTGIELIVEEPTGMGVGVLLFAIGSIVVLVTRIGFVPQAVGLFIFLGDFLEVKSSAQTGDELVLLIGVTSGYVLAVTSFLICSFGTHVPLWRKSTPRIIPASSRVIALSPNASRIGD